jgi:phage gp29-like protein
MDIRDSDCTQVEETSNVRILDLWTAWNYGPDAPSPRMKYDVEEAKDTEREARVVKTLDEAGWDVDAEQVEANTGYRVTRRETPPPAAADAAALSDDVARAMGRGFVEMLRQGLGGAHAVAMQAAGNDSADIPDRIADSALPAARKATFAMFAPLQDRLDEIAGIADDGAFREAVAALSDELPGMLPDLDSDELETVMAELIYGATAAGKADRAEHLARREA